MEFKDITLAIAVWEFSSNPRPDEVRDVLYNAIKLMHENRALKEELADTLDTMDAITEQARSRIAELESINTTITNEGK